MSGTKIKILLSLICLAVLVQGCGVKSSSISINGDVMQASSSNIMWQKNRGPLFTSWAKANNYVQKLELGGYNDWRLPTKEEFLKLYFAFDYGSADAKKLGVVIEGNYWSADKNGRGFTGAWKDGDSCEIKRDYKTSTRGYVRAVRP